MNLSFDLTFRLAAQELLVAELKNLGPKGRKHLVDVWGAYLPKYGDPPFQTGSAHPGMSNGTSGSGGNSNNSGGSGGGADGHHGDGEDDLDDDFDEDADGVDNAVVAHRRNQTTAVILLGVIGALFDLEAEKQGQSEIALGTHMTRLTAKALMYLVLTSSRSAGAAAASAHLASAANNGHGQHQNQMQQQQQGSTPGSTPSSTHGANTPTVASSASASAASHQVLPTSGKQSSPANSALRRAAIDLIGRGFVMWEPHLEVSKVILGLLEMTCEADWWVPSGKYGLPLTPAGDACRTSRLALALIARVRPAVFITSVSKEIARYNNLAANAQALNINVTHHVLARSKAEILHLVELLIEHNRAELADLLVDVVDIVLHCVEQNHIKSRSLAEVFTPIVYFPQISHCTQTRRIAVGTRSGQLAMYEMKGANKIQMIPAHTGRIVAVCFGPDGKSLASFSSHDNKLYFWQTSTSMFGLGQSQTKCTKSYNVAPSPNAKKWSATYTPKLVWISPKTVTLLMPDGTESRFNC